MTPEPTGDRPTLRFMLARPQHLLALSGGAGLSPVWPGTVGSLVGFPLFLVLQHVAPTGRAAVYGVLIVLGILCCGATSRALGRPDHRGIVWDETVGMSLVLEMTPAGVSYWALAFLLFRFFDAAKPWPINRLDVESHSGFFIMFDDLLAAAFSVAAILLIERYAPLVPLLHSIGI